MCVCIMGVRVANVCSSVIESGCRKASMSV